MSETIQNLRVFKKSHELTYKLTTYFPNEEKFGLASQIRRASSSICANLMEESHRRGKNEYRRFASISRGSAGELKYHLLLAKDLNYTSENNYHRHLTTVDDVSKMLNGLIGSLEYNTLNGSRITDN